MIYIQNNLYINCKMIDSGCISIIDQDVRNLDQMYNKNRYENSPHWFWYPYSKYQIAKKGEPFHPKAVEFQNRWHLKISQSSLKIKAILDQDTVRTYDQFVEDQKLEDERIERWKQGVQKAKLITTCMWLGLMP